MNSIMNKYYKTVQVIICFLFAGVLERMNVMGSEPQFIVVTPTLN